MVYDAGKLRSSIVSVLISVISDMGLIEPQNIMGVGPSCSLLSGSLCVALVLQCFLVKHNHCHGEIEQLQNCTRKKWSSEVILIQCTTEYAH